MKRLMLALGMVGGLVLAASTAGAQEVVVRMGPPAPMHEHGRPPRPDPGSQWVAGYHHWEGNAWAWHPGHWETPERPGGHWVAPQYRHVHGEWRYVPGRWR